MKPESAAFLAKSQDFLSRAPGLLVHGFFDDSGRAAYLAGFHAAQAFLFERLDRSPKTHSGVQTAFASLARGEPTIDRHTRAFLGRAYNLKAVADYETGPDARVSREQASKAIAAAERFVAVIQRLVADDRSN